MGSLPLESLHELADRDVGRYGDEEMHVIFGDSALEDLHIIPLAYLSGKISESLRHLPIQNLFPVLGDPYEVVLEVIDRMRSFTVVLHSSLLLKSSPKGEGFSPSPRGRH